MSKEADNLAKACAEVMWASDNASRGLCMEIEEVREGYARLTMPIRGDMTNGQKIAHGGFIFVHDYNNAEYEGIRRAVHEFCEAENIGFVPISDAFGTAIIAK